jgi:hypothetical protein
MGAGARRRLAMTDSFEDLLAELRPDADAIQQAARYYLAERTGDLSVDAMRAQMAQTAGEDVVDQTVATLEQDSAAVETACLTVLAAAWENPEERNAVRGALEDAKEQMPVIEIAIIAIVAAYGMYLLATRGRRKVSRVKRRHKDGTYEEIEMVDFADPTEPLRAITRLFP